MSEPKRYEPSPYKRLCISTDEDDEGNLYCAVEEDSEGEFVLWTDYARLKENLRLQIEQNALAQVGFKMYQDNVDSGGLHKDRKDAIARLEAENARLQSEVTKWKSWAEAEHAEKKAMNGNDDLAKLKAEVERLTKAASQVYQELDEFGQVSAKSVHELRDAAKGGKQP